MAPPAEGERCGRYPLRPLAFDLIRVLERPDEDVESLRVVQQRLALEGHRCDGLELDLALGRLERPRRVVDVGALVSVGRVEAVPLGQEVLERARTRVE